MSKASKKIKYETPKLVSLDTELSGESMCLTGSRYVFPINCGGGTNATQCNPGGYEFSHCNGFGLCPGFRIKT